MNKKVEKLFFLSCQLLFMLIVKTLPCISQVKFEISGVVDNSIYISPQLNLNDGDIMTLDFINFTRSDTAVISEGKFHFMGSVDIPSVAMLNFKGGGMLLLIDESEYNLFFALTEFSPNKYTYIDTRVETKSKFYNLWKTLRHEKGDLLAVKKEIEELLKGDLIDAERSSYLFEMEEVDRKLSNLYYKASKENYGTYEMTYLLPAAPDFSYSRYIDYYNDLPPKVQNSFYGKNLYQRLLLTQPTEK